MSCQTLRFAMLYLISHHHVDPILIAVIRSRVKQADLSTVVPQQCGEVWSFCRAAGLPKPGRHVAYYLDGEINLEVGVEVVQPFVGNDRVVCSALPGGMVASTIHMGPYSQLGAAHLAIHDWCKQQGHTLAGPSWEIYGHWSDDPAQVRTDVFYLLKP
jgi:effector-binding domain-containing protein